MYPTENNRAYRRFSITGIRRDGVKSARLDIAKKWQEIFNASENELGHYITSPFEISQKCCDYLKKKSSNLYVKTTGTFPILGMMAAEGGPRREAYMKHGCNRLGSNPSSNPMSFWTHNDILEYIAQNDIKVAEVYDMGYERTGCVFCMFGVHMEKPINRFQLLKQTHPKLWTYCMDRLGLRIVMGFLKLPIE